MIPFIFNKKKMTKAAKFHKKTYIAEIPKYTLFL